MIIPYRFQLLAQAIKVPIDLGKIINYLVPHGGMADWRISSVIQPVFCNGQN